MRLLKSNNIIRDIFFVFLLIHAGKTIIEKNGITYKRSLYNLYDVHEVDPALLVQARECTKQIQKTLAMLWPNEHDLQIKQLLVSLEKEAQNISDAYEKNSPAFALLGPIGSAATVLKEKNLEKKLLETVNRAGIVFAKLAQERQKEVPLPEPTTNIERALQKNKKALQLLSC